MERKKRKRKVRAKIKKKLSDINDRLQNVYNKYDFPGVVRIVLSEPTQEEIGCVLGTTHTIEVPWNYVEKEKILDNLEEHVKSSEFLSIKHLIDNYSEEKILMGYEKSLSNNKDEFFICTTIICKDQVLAKLEQEKQRKRKRTQNKLSKFIRKWKTLGSEREIEKEMNKNYRPLWVVEINSDYLIFKTRLNFSFRLVQDSQSGYVEFTPPETFSFANISRKRIDSGTQVISARATTEVQTNFVRPVNCATQYDYLYDDNLLGADLDLIENLRFFLRRHITNITESILVNNSIHFFHNDYQKNAHFINKSKISTPELIYSVHNAKSNDASVTSVTWHPMISGIIAVAYTPIEYYIEDAGRSLSTKGFDASLPSSDHVVLIWSYDKLLKPLLTLISYREVTKLSFCPHDGNLLIGGCGNGQIVLWDLTGKLPIYGSTQFTQNKTPKIKIGMFVEIHCLKKVMEDLTLYPTAVSNMNYGHRAEISDISWISPDYQIDSRGRFTKSKIVSKQFVSSSTDSSLLIWSLNLKQQLYDKNEELSPRTAHRVSLFGFGSPYKVLHTVLRPIYQIIMHAPTKNKGCFIESIIIPIFNLKYVPRNPETRSDFIKRTFFKPEMIQNELEVERNLLFTTSEGILAEMGWEGYDFDPGLVVNFENAKKYSQSQQVHDGPIRTCLPHPVIKDVLLTVGGRVFAIWSDQNRNKPIMWRKCPVRYMSGIWSPQNSCHVFIARMDSCFEIWDLHEQAKVPSKIIKCPGKVLLNMYGETSKIHVRKGTFVVSDAEGKIKLYLVPNFQIDISDASKQKAQQLFDIYKAKQNHFRRIMAMCKDLPQRIIEEEAPAPVIDFSDMIKTLKEDDTKGPFYQFSQHKYMKREEKQMYESLLKKKNINLAELESNLGPLEVLLKKRQYMATKLEIIKQKQNIVYENARHVISRTRKTPKKHINFIIRGPNSLTLKKLYIAEYQDMEPRMLRFIRLNNYSIQYNRANTMSSSKGRRWNLFQREIDEDLHAGRSINENILNVMK